MPVRMMLSRRDCLARIAIGGTPLAANFLIHGSSWASAPENPFVDVDILGAVVADNASGMLASHVGAILGREVPNAKPLSPPLTTPAVKALLDEFDQFTVKLCGRIRELLPSRMTRVTSAVNKERWEDSSLSNERVREWISKNNSLVLQTYGLNPLARLLWVLAPGMIEFPMRGRSDIYGVETARRFGIYAMVNSEPIARVLPERFDVARLRDLERDVTDSGVVLREKSRFYYPDGPLFRTGLAAQDILQPELGDIWSREGMPLTETIASQARRK